MSKLITLNLRGNLGRIIPGSPEIGYSGIKFGKAMVEGQRIPNVGAILGPLLSGQGVAAEDMETLKPGSIVVKSRTADGKTHDLRSYTDTRTGQRRWLLDEASFDFVDGETKAVHLFEDNVNYAEVWSGIWDNEMEALQLIQDGAFGFHGPVAYNGGEEVVAAKGKRAATLRPTAQQMPVELVGMIGDVVVWEIGMWRMPFQKRAGSELLLRARPNGEQLVIESGPRRFKIAPADTKTYREDYDQLMEAKLKGGASSEPAPPSEAAAEPTATDTVGDEKQSAS